MTSSRTEAGTTTISAADVRAVHRDMGTEIGVIVRAFHGEGVDFDLDQTLIDLGIMQLNGLIRRIRVQAYLGGQIVREHAYEILDEAVDAWGPDPDNPPLGDVPAGCRLRLIVTQNETLPSSVREEWFRRLGWVNAESLAYPPNARHEKYGAFASGGYAVNRSYLADPSQAHQCSDDSIFTKGDRW